MATADRSASIHLWVASLDRPPEPFPRLARTLASDEWEQARRLRFARDRRRFVARRGLRRLILARYTGSDPARLEFVHGERGKPELAGGEIRFSASHSRGLAVYALGEGRPLGVDLEHLRPVTGAAEIARTLFCPEEYHALRALPAGEMQRAFFACWTRKEAYLKALGTGLAEALDRFAVTVAPHEPARLEHVNGDRDRAAGWSLAPFTPAPGFVGAVAAAGRGWSLAWRRW